MTNPSVNESAEALRKFVDSAAVYIYVVDYHTDDILMVNNFYASHVGVSIEKMEGRKCWEYVTGEDGGRCPECPRDMDLDGTGCPDMNPATTEFFNPTLGIWAKCTSQGISWVDGRAAHIITVIDISSEKLLKEELLRLAYYDDRMNIPNRLKMELDLNERASGNYCIIAFDYVSLRYINDAYGRPLVDSLLDTVVAWIRSFEMQSYEIYRVDSDQFCLLFDNADMISASGLADRLNERFQEPWAVGLDGGRTIISCRIAICVIDGRLGFSSTNDILSIIDRTLDISKSTQSVAVYNSEMDEILRRNLQLEVSLKNSVQEGMVGFDVYFQPIVDPATKLWIGLEALCRWDSPEFGRIPPLVFIRVAEQIGVINKLGYWVLDTAIRVCSEFGLQYIDGFFLDVNLSPSQISDETLINSVLVSLQKHNFPGQNLSLEVTESQELSESDYSQTNIERLKSLEIKMALDDFGTGYSNFNNLKNLTVSILKTEKEFIDDIANDEYQQFLSKVLSEMAHKAKMTLIAEGVETKEQLVELLKNNVDYLQGYLFAKPMTIEELGKMIYKFKEPDIIWEQL